MSPFSPGKFRFLIPSIFFLFLAISGCDKKDEIPQSDPTHLEVLLSYDTTNSLTERIDSFFRAIYLPGTNEPFFDEVPVSVYQPGKIPRVPNLLLILSTSTIANDTLLHRIFTKPLLAKVTRGNRAEFFMKENLFYTGQTLWIVVYTKPAELEELISNRFTLISATIMSTSITKVLKRDIGKSGKESSLSEEVRVVAGVDLKVPEGFEKVKGTPAGSILLRRGAGTKTEEWILINELQNVQMTFSMGIRDSITAKIIRYQDGSAMKSISMFNYLGDGSYFRGSWETYPYPMAGVFTSRVLNKGKKRIYIEAGIYSPGRNKTLNLLRLEKMIRDLK